MSLIATSTADLLAQHADILSELRRRGVVRSANAPGGDYAELLFAQAFGWRLENNSASGHDAVDQDGTLYQIKCRRISLANTGLQKGRQLSAIRRLPDRPFDVLAAVLFDDQYRVWRAALIPFEQVHANASYVAYVNAWRFILRDSIWNLTGVQDVTEKLRATQIGAQN